MWRRLLVASDTTIAELHEILQSAFDWSGEHLHRFLIHGAAYGIRCLGGIVFEEDARRVPLSRFGLHCGERFRYEYDFTADWRLDIRLEKALPFGQDRALPLCIGGSRAAPPEDCPGAWDYLERLDRHKYQPPIEELGIMAEAVQRRYDAQLHARNQLKHGSWVLKIHTDCLAKTGWKNSRHASPTGKTY